MIQRTHSGTDSSSDQGSDQAQQRSDCRTWTMQPRVRVYFVATAEAETKPDDS